MVWNVVGERVETEEGRAWVRETVRRRGKEAETRAGRSGERRENRWMFRSGAEGVD